MTARTIEEHLGVSRPTALRTLDRLSELGILSESSPGPRSMRRFVASEILAVFETD
ncbi:MAG: HTH domain-containing protein [Acidimicrobiia bacterium]|nr:HTH domain-containing protein [Acidimicrobiia bacterium]NNF89444.1 HTH domain-containing protein [Acidimicrobiia bacterium]NNL97881.1 HTH domain-containing protein [Acidimicrobiia bacterium]